MQPNHLPRWSRHWVRCIPVALALLGHLAASASIAQASQSRHDREAILAWRIAGPYERDALNTEQLLAHAFAPESDRENPAVFWRDQQSVDSNRPSRITLAPGGDRVIYARTSIWCETQMRSVIELDGVSAARLWIGLTEVPALASSAPNHFIVLLQTGWNDVMFKLALPETDEDAWFAGHVRSVDGTPLAALRIDPFQLQNSAPHDAIVLFDGSSLEHWRRAGSNEAARWRIDDDAMVVRPGSGSIETSRHFEDFTLHVEYMCPAGVASDIRGQARSNSGVYLLGSYEVQVLDSWGEPARINEAGALYNVRPPDVNASRPPGLWQTYDIEFISPRFDDFGVKLSNARVTVFHNGVLIHDDVQLAGPTGAGSAEQPGGGPILLQDHGNALRFRNIWIIPHTSWDGDAADDFEPLARRGSLEGWSIRGGEAVYAVDGDTIIGETRPSQPNTFLCTKRNDTDFILELEFKVDDDLNSGVQIRSNSIPAYNNGRVHGYQVEIDPSDRAWSAGIYDEARRGWLADLADLPAARGAFQHGTWNQLRIVARGPVIRTYLNDIPAAMLVDGMTRTGFVGLQVHGVGDREEPLRVRWRDLRIKTISD